MDERSKQKGKKMSKKNFTFTDEQKADFVARYNDLVSADKLAKEVGCSTPTMLRHLRAWGVTIRGKGRLKADGAAVAAPATPVETPVTEVVETPEVTEVSEPTDTESVEDSVEADSDNQGFFNRMFASFGR